jgi:hypothetical protein
MRFQFSLMVALALAPLLTSQEKPVTHCCASDPTAFRKKQLKL